MSKKLITIVSAIMAFVLCFCLIGCGGDKIEPVPPKPQKPDFEQVEKGFKRLIYAESGYTGTLVASIKSAKDADGTAVNAQFEKRGTRVKATSSGDEYLFDTATGYLYALGTNVASKQAVPGGGVSFLTDVLLSEYGKADKTELTAEFNEMNYDENTRTFSDVIDLKDDVNKALAPAIAAYGGDKSIEWLVNTYLEGYTGSDELTLASILDKAIEFYDLYQETPLGTVFLAVEALVPGLSVKSLIVSTLGITDAQYEAIKARKLDEAVAALVKYIAPIVTPGSGGVSLGSIKANIKPMIRGALSAALFDEVTQADIDDVPAALETAKVTVLNYARSTTVKAVVDKMPAGDIKTVIASNVTFGKLTIDVAFAVDESGNISSFKTVCELNHSYSGDGTGLRLLADNNYVAEVDLAVSNVVVTSETSFDIPAVAVALYDITAVVTKYTAGVKQVYLECPAGAEVSNVSASYSAGGVVKPTTAAVTFDGATKRFDVTAAVDECYADITRDGNYLTVSFTVNGNAGSLNIYIAPDKSVGTLVGGAGLFA